ncbi:MAG: hypothetical protein AB7L17_00205 [Ilumatobacteraceae bacterium]
MSEPDTRRDSGRDVIARRVLLVLAAGSVLLLGILGLVRRSGPASASLPAADRVVIVAVPGLRWQDLAAVETPHLDDLLPASALLSVRAIGAETTLLEGYLTLGAGNRLDAPRPDALDVAGRTCVPELVPLAEAQADDELNGAVPGALGTALHAAGRSTGVFGSPDAIAALMDGRGCVDARGDLDHVSFEADVSLVELPGLDDADTAAERVEVLRSIDGKLAQLAVPDDALVMVLAPHATDDEGNVVVAGLRARHAGGDDVSSLVSPSTRRSGYVQLIDVAPTVLDVLGVDRPEAMSGTPIQSSAAGERDMPSRVAQLADLADRVAFRDRAVGPVSVVLVVLTVFCGVAGLSRRSRIARGLAAVVAAYVPIAFLVGLVGYDELPLDFVVVAIPAVAAFVGAVVVGSTSRWGPRAPVFTLIAALWLVLVVDVFTGGSLQINTPLGYSPTVAGRFQGFGNLAFGLVSSASLVVAMAAAVWSGRRLAPAGWAAWIGAVTAIAVAAPAFGSDVGGTLAIVPAFAGLVAVLAGRRIGVRSAVLVGVGTVALVVGLAFADRARPESSRTHLGRFLDQLLDGEAGLVLRRKLKGNLTILTSSFWSFILIGVVLALVVVCWRHRDDVRRMFAGRPTERAFLTGFAIVAVLGFALNDSGLAVPAVMLNVVVPWLVVSLLPVVERRGR